MRKFILIAALVLASASAQAAGSRSLSLASNDDQAATEQPKAVEAPKPVESPKAVEDAKPAETPKVETPKYVDRPAAVNTATETTKTDAVQPATVPAPKVAQAQAAPRLDRSAHHRRTASPRHLLVARAAHSSPGIGRPARVRPMLHVPERCEAVHTGIRRSVY